MFGTPFGAYVDRDDPPIVYVFDTRDKFGAMRVGGVWRRPKSSPTIGDLAEDWKPVASLGEAEAALSEARKSLS